jgi:hypothetical protein
MVFDRVRFGPGLLSGEGFSAKHFLLPQSYYIRPRGGPQSKKIRFTLQKTVLWIRSGIRIRIRKDPELLPDPDPELDP